jgi:phage terminase large subunit-like protein
MGLRGPGAKPKAKSSKKPGRKAQPKPWEAPGLSRAERVIAFIESLKITVGKTAGSPFLLREWQKAKLRRVYDPVDGQGRRIARTVLDTMARKNGKTALAAALALCHMAGPEAEPRGQVYSAASDRDQAALIFAELEAFINADDDLASRCNIVRFHKKIEVLSGPGAGTTYAAMSSDARKAHGRGPSFSICDELAQWPGRELYDNLTTGTGARDEPLNWVISTQSSDPLHVMSELVDYGRRVMSGEVDDPSFVAFIAEVPDDLDIWDEANWPLANPALGDFRSLIEMRQMAAKAKRMPSFEGVFRNLYLNQRVSPDEAFIAAPEWRACAKALSIDECVGLTCYGGLDLSSTTDLTALLLGFPDADLHLSIFPFFWLPEGTLREREEHDRVPYSRWRDEGFLFTTPGRAIDKRFPLRFLASCQERFDLRVLRYDRWRIEDLKTLAADDGITLPLEPHGQGYKDMGPAVESFETAILNRTLYHPNHPILNWNAANARTIKDPTGARKVCKVKSTGRVDGIVAALMAVAAAQNAQPANPFIFGGEAVIAA